MKRHRRGVLSLQFIIPNIVLLLVVATSVELTYRFYVRPRVTDLMIERRLTMASAGDAVAQIQSQPLLLVIKDHEPEVEIIFFIWGTLFVAYRMYIVHREQRLLEHDFVQISPGERILPARA